MSKYNSILALERLRNENFAGKNAEILKEIALLHPKGSLITYQIGNMKEPAVGEVIDHYTNIDTTGCTVQNTKTKAVRPVSIRYILDKAEAPAEELQPELG